MTHGHTHERSQQQHFYPNIQQFSLILNDDDNLYLTYIVKSNELIFET